MKRSVPPIYVNLNIGLIAVLLFLLVGVFSAGLLVAPHFTNNAQAAALPQAQTAGDEALLAAFEQAMVDVYQEALPSTVNIRVTLEFDQDMMERFNFGDPDERDDFTPENQPESEDPDDSTPENQPSPEDFPPDFFNQGGGSGFVWDNEGHIVTNHHVIANASKIEVIFADDTVREAQLVGSDPDSDLAVIKVDLPANAPPLKLGDSEAMQVGQLAIAVGNPFGQDFTMTSGIVSGVGRLIRGGNSGFSIPEVIQTDAAINPGNSGGPLINRQGEVIGINTQILSRSGSNSGVGFAVPINIAKRVVPTLIAGNNYEYAWLGIGGSSLTSEINAFRELTPETQGALVFSVVEDGPAAEAGLQGRDESLSPEDEAYRFGGEIITAINGEPIRGIEDLITYLVEETEPGDEVTLDVIQNDGQTTQVTVTLGVRPQAEDTPSQR